MTQEIRETKSGRKVIIDRGMFTKGSGEGQYVKAKFLDIENAAFQPMLASKLKPKQKVKVSLEDL